MTVLLGLRMIWEKIVMDARRAACAILGHKIMRWDVIYTSTPDIPLGSEFAMCLRCGTETS